MLRTTITAECRGNRELLILFIEFVPFAEYRIKQEKVNSKRYKERPFEIRLDFYPESCKQYAEWKTTGWIVFALVAHQKSG